MRRIRFSLLSVVALLGVAVAAHAEMPIVTDSRIKTFVYNPNEVFTVTTHYGYQSNIEFGEKETIDTVSVGDRVAWQIIPAGRRLFIRAQEENAHTNMTIVTNQRAYQFDLRSSSADAVFGSEELTYVVRFFYPGESAGNPPMATYTPTPMAAPVTPVQATPISYAPPSAAAPMAAPRYDRSPSNGLPNPQLLSGSGNQPMNYRYTFSGPQTAAPVKIYDDGRTTYFKYNNSVIPKIAVITAKGEQLAVPTRTIPGNTVAVDIVAPRFSLSQPGGQVIVYNEANGA